jgi:hypothetical protein
VPVRLGYRHNGIKSGRQSWMKCTCNGGKKRKGGGNGWRKKKKKKKE